MKCCKCKKDKDKCDFIKNGKEFKRWLGIIDEELVFESVKELENSK